MKPYYTAARLDEVEAIVETAIEIQGRSLWDDALGRLIRNRAAVVSIVILGLIAIAALIGPLLIAYPFDYQNYDIVSCAPDWWPDEVVLCNAGGTHFAVAGRRAAPLRLNHP